MVSKLEALLVERVAEMAWEFRAYDQMEMQLVMMCDVTS